MSRSFCTDLVPLSDRLDAWLWNAQQICGNCRFQFPRLPFSGLIEQRSLSGFELTCFSSTPIAFAKFPLSTGTSPDRSCVIISQVAGTQRYTQGETTVRLNPSDTTFIDAGQPWTSDCSYRCSRLYLRVPRWLVQDRLGMETLPVLPRVSGRSSLGAALSHLAATLYRDAEALPTEEGSAMVSAYLDILARCIRPADLPATLHRGAQLRTEVDRFIDANIQDPGLTPAQIAAATGISVRHLHRLFGDRGCTVAEWIWQQRLDRCRTDLSHSQASGRSITEIAFSWGFSDSAHFSRCFRKTFGLSPREFKSRASSMKFHALPTILPPRRLPRPN